MANKNIQIKGSFDASQILASFKKIRDEAAKSNISDKLLGGYDKELEKVEKLTTQILAAQSRGLTDNQSIKEFARLVSQLEKQYGILNVKAQAFTDAANYKTETAEIRQYSNQLKTLIDRQKSLEKSARDYIDANSDALKLSKEESKALKQSISDAQAYKDVLDEIVQKRIDAAKQKIADRSLSTTGGSQKYAEITGQTTNFTLSAADKKGRDTSRKSLVGRNGQFDETKAITVANQEYNRILEDSIVNNRTAEDALQEMIKTMRAYKLELGDTEEVQKKFAQDLASIKDAAWENHSNLTGNDKGAFTRVEHKVDAIKSNASGLYNNTDVSKVEQVSKEAVDIADKMTTAQNRNAQATKDATERQKQLGDAAVKAGKQQLDEYKDIEKEAQKYVNIQDSIKNGFDSIGQGAKQILSVTTAWRSLRNVIRNTFNDVKALDKSFASIAMVTEYSVKDMWAQYDQYAEMANRLGQSTQSVVEASGLYYQQGLKTNEVLKLTEETMKLATLAGLDFKEATSQMTAALRAFHMDMSEGAHVTDVYAEVAAHAAVDVQGLSEAMSATAAIANSAGMSFENTTAMLATMVEATQEAPKNLGTAMKTILARFTELKTNVAGTADSEFDDLDYNKVDKALKSVGVNIKDATGQFRDMDEVLLELSSKWKGLDRNSQRYIATIAAGSRQQSRFIALMENYERTMELVDVAQNSAGRSSQQFAKYQDTVEYRLNKIKNSWEQFRTSLLDSDAYKGALDLFGGFLEKLNNASATGLATLAGTWLTFGRKAIGGAINGWSDLGSGLANKFAGGGQDKESFLANASRNWINKHRGEDGYTITHIGANGATTIDNEEALEAQGLAEAEKAWKAQEQKVAVKSKAIGNIISTGIATAITTGLTIDDPITAGLTATATSAVSLLPTFIQLGKTLGAGTGTAIGAAVTVAIGAISLGLSAWRKHLQDEENKTLTKRIDNTKKQLEKETQLLEQKQADRKGSQAEIKNLEEIKKRYSELNSKIVLNEEEQKEYNELVDNLKENYPSLIAEYDAENNKIKLQTNLLDDKIKKLKEIEKEQKKDELVASLNKLDSTQRLDLLNIQKKYEDKIGISSDSVKTAKGMIGADSLVSFNGNNFEEYSQGITELAESVGITGDKLETIKNDLKDFKAAYKQKAGMQEQERYSEILSKLREAYPGKKESELSAYASAFATNNTLRNSRYSKINLSDMYEYSFAFNDADVEDVYNSKYFKSYSGIPTDFSGIDFKAYKELNDYSKQIWSSIGVASQKELDEFIKNNSGKDIIEKLEKAAENMADSEAIDEYIEKAPKNLEKVTNDIEKLRKKKNKLTVDEYLTEAKKIQDFNEQFDLGQNLNINNQLNLKQFEDYQKILDKLSLTSSKTFQNLSADVVESQSQIFQNLINKFGESGDLGKTYESFVKTIKNFNLTPELQNKLLQFDPSQLDGMTKNEARDTLMQLFQSAIDDGKIGEEAAKKTVNNYLNELEKSNLGDFSILSASALTKIEGEIKEKYNKIITNYKTAIDTINSNITNGFIDYLDKDKIEDAIKELKLDPADYIYTDEKGNYQVDVEALNEDVKKQAANESDITKEIEAQIKNGIEQLTQKESLIQSIINQCKGEQENYRIQKQLTKEYAKQNALRNDANWEDISTQYDIDWEDNGSALINSSTLNDLNTGLKQIQTQRAELQKSLNDKDYIQSLANMAKGAENKIDQVYKTYTDTLKDFGKERDKAYKDWQDKTRAVADAQKSLAKAIETVAEKQKELKATIEGTNWKSSLDGMYNYNTALDFLTKQTERAKKDLEKASTIDAAKRNFAVYGQGLLDQKAQLQAQNQVYRTAYNNIGKVYNNDVAKLIKSFEDSGQMEFNLADYLVFDEKTGTKINMNALQKAKMPEALKKWIETQGQKANEYLTKIWDNDDKVKQLNEEFIEHQRQALDGYVELQDKMIEVLREKYQKQVDDLRTKYEAMNEADDQYLNALQKNIDKQRKLRDQERSWNDLENKERKLALLRRDTSRGNAVEVRSLEKEVQDDRTSILDSAVDDIIEKLREFYELQKEQRELEITYQETLIDDVALMKEATEALQKIQTSDELVNWWKENVANMEKMSDEKLLKEKQDWTELFKKKTEYVASVDDTVLRSIQNSEKNLKDVADKTEEIVRTTSEGITELASKSLEEAGNEYKEAIKKAKEALADAVDAVAKQKEALQAALDAANESKKAFDDIAAKYKEALSKNTQSAYVVIDSNGNKKAYDDHAAAVRSIESLPQNERTRTIGQQSVSSKDITKTDTTPYSNTGNLSQNWQPKTIYIGKNSNGEAVVYDNKNSFNNYNPYKFTQELKLKAGIAHGVLSYNEKKEEWELLKPYDKIEEAEKHINDNAPKVNSPTDSINRNKYLKNHLAFAEGGLVNFTGPAWVDGSRSRPEAFLSAEDTRRIGEAARILADLPILSQPVNQEQLPTTTIGDTTIQIDVHVDSIASDYDLDEAMDKVEKRIVEAAKYTGSNVILKKR